MPLIEIKCRRIELYDLLEGANAGNLISRVNDGGRFSLGPHQYYIDEFRGGRHRAHLLEVIDWHDCLLYDK
jgi:hypothetical protein